MSQKKLDSETTRHLQNQLIKLGDMMGDGLHHEPGGKWIEREYRKVCKALGIIKNRPPRTDEINERMVQRVADFSCGNCGGVLKQTRSGSKRAVCQSCGAKWQLLK